MQSNKKNRYTILILVVVLVIALLIGGTFAYFNWTTTDEQNSRISVTIEGGGTGSCSKKTDNEKILIPTANREGGRIITIDATQQMAEYANITWTLTINSINESSLATSGLKNESFKYELVNTTTGKSYGSGNFSNLKEGSTVTFSANEPLKINTNYTFALYLWIDGSMSNPNDMQNQPYDFDIVCNITRTEPPATATISNLYTNAEKTVVTNNSIQYNYAPSVNLMNDRLGDATKSIDAGNIRYYGNNPSNYIYFNCSDYNNQSSSTCEIWRIIGIFKDIELADGTKKDLVKIIRNENLGFYIWDNKDTSTGSEDYDGKNDWTTARLMKLLNPSDYFTVDANDNGYGQSLYWNSESGTCFNNGYNGTKSCDFTSTGLKNEETRNMIAEVIWNLGGANTLSIYSDQMYKYERGATSWQNSRPTTWTGKVALSYPSDYGYAADFEKCTQTLDNYRDCRTWLSGYKNQWVLTPSTRASGEVFYYNNAYYSIGTSSAYYTGNAVRPALYLSPEVSIMSGNGLYSSPYKLGV